MSTRCRFSICREGWVYLVVVSVVVVASILREINLLMILAGMMIGPLLINWRMVRNTLQRITMQRKIPAGISAGDLVSVDLSISNGRRRLGSWALNLRDQITRISDENPAAPAEQARMFVAALPAGETKYVGYRGRLLERGRYQLGPLRVSTRIPLGLISGYIDLTKTDELVVYPKLGNLTPQWAKLIEPDRSGGQRSQRQRGLLEGDYYGLRDWRTGDSRRWIHWRTSAKRNQLSIRQFEKRSNRDLGLILDLSFDGSATGVLLRDKLDDIELAISFAGTVVAEQCRRGSSELMLAIGGQQQQIVRGLSSAGLRQDTLEKLGEVAATANDILPQVLEEALAAMPHGAQMVLVSTGPVNLHDTERFSSIWQDSHMRTSLQRIVCIDVTSASFQNYFLWDESSSTTIQDENATWPDARARS